MKTKQIIFFILSFFYINISFSQKNQRGKNEQFIITNSNDTIKDIRVINKRKYTNQNIIKYLDKQKTTHSLSSEKIKKYYDGKNIFISEEDSINDKHILIHYFADGYLKAGEAYTKKNEVIYFLKIKNEIIPLKSHKIKLSEFLIKKIDRFKSFTAVYNKKIYYNYKSIGEMVAAYNAFLFPEKYIPVKYKNKQYFSLGLMVSPFSYSTIKNKNNIPLYHKYSFQTGFILNYNYTLNISFSLIPSFYKNYFSSEISKLYINSFNTELQLNLIIFKKNRSEIVLNPGTSMIYHHNTHLITKNFFNYYQNITYNSLSLGYFIKTSYGFNKHLYANLGLHFFHVKNNTYTPAYIYYPTTNYISEIRIGFSYLFNQKEVIKE